MTLIHFLIEACSPAHTQIKAPQARPALKEFVVGEEALRGLKTSGGKVCPLSQHCNRKTP